MAKTVRIAAGGIRSETCTFSPLPTKIEDFDIERGTDLLQRYDFTLRDHDVELYTLFHAYALPGGPVTKSASSLNAAADCFS